MLDAQHGQFQVLKTLGGHSHKGAPHFGEFYLWELYQDLIEYGEKNPIASSRERRKETILKYTRAFGAS